MTIVRAMLQPRAPTQSARGFRDRRLIPTDRGESLGRSGEENGVPARHSTVDVGALPGSRVDAPLGGALGGALLAPVRSSFPIPSREVDQSTQPLSPRIAP